MTHARTRSCLALALVTCVLGIELPSRLHAQQDGGPLILISLDGFRWDYLQSPEAPNLRALAARGVHAEGLIPIFPAVTFPNHYTIVTGLYADRHGIVANDIFDAPSGRRFALSDPAEVRDPLWWGGEPIWVTAERAGLRTATMFWPGSEAPIQGIRPTNWRAYDESLSGSGRVDQVLQWLDEPEARRPAFVTLYFEDADTAGHQAGPDSADVQEAIGRLDGYLERLLSGLERRNLLGRTNLVIVSDHGMAAVSGDRVLELDDYIALADVDVVDINPTLGLFPAPGKEEAVLQALRRAGARLRVYARAETPAEWHYRAHARIPPIVGVVEEGWEIIRGTVTERIARAVRRPRGMHGYDPSVRAMHGIFVAAGPAFRRGLVVPRFESVHVYNVLAAALGIEPSTNDGDPALPGSLLQGATDQQQAAAPIRRAARRRTLLADESSRR